MSDIPLTDGGIEPTLQARMNATVKGQATWVDLTSTRQCKDCVHFTKDGVMRSGDWGYCNKAKQVSGGRSQGQLPGKARACTFFEERSK